MERKMDRDGGVQALGICDLPTDCVARIVSLTSPGDACRLAATAVALRAAADSDEVWESFLPADCANILERCTSDEPPPRGGSETKKEFFFRLCNTPVLLDGGKLSFSLERCSGAEKYMIPAKALCFGWSGYPYGGLVWSHHHPHSRFCEVAVLSHLCWLDVYGIFNTKHLSNGGRGYGAYLVYRVHWLHIQAGQNHNQAEAGSSSSSFTNDICSHECNHLVPHKHMRSLLWDWGWELDGSTLFAQVDKTKENPKRKPKPDGVGVRSDGRWMEQEINIELDEQCLQGKESNVSIEFRGLTGSHRCQVIVEGIEIRPRSGKHGQLP